MWALLPGASKTWNTVHISLLTIYIFPPTHVCQVLISTVISGCQQWPDESQSFTCLRKMTFQNYERINYLFGQPSWLSPYIFVSSEKKEQVKKVQFSLHGYMVSTKCNTYRATIRASCSASFTAASSSSLDKGAPPFLSLAYQVRSLPFCHRPTGAIREFPGNTIMMKMCVQYWVPMT